jgi:hypothetical protein
MEITVSVLSAWPSGPGYTPDEGSNFDYMPKTAANLDAAKKYMLKAKQQGVPVSSDGKSPATRIL